MDMERIQVTSASGGDMSLHGGEWRIHASAVDEGKVIEDALSWLSGGLSEIIIHKRKVNIGSPDVDDKREDEGEASTILIGKSGK